MRRSFRFEQRQADAFAAMERRQQLGGVRAQLLDEQRAKDAAMANMTALLAQDDARSFGSGRVIARDRNRAIKPTAIIEREPILCWNCQNPLKDEEIDPNGRVVACKKCSDAHEAEQAEREEIYQLARQERVETAMAEHDEWRLAQYEHRLGEQAELDARKGLRYDTGAINQDCESIQGSFGMDYLYNPILRQFFELGSRCLVPLKGDLILESGYKKEQVSGSGWVYWLLVENSIVVVEVWEEGLFSPVIEKVEVL